jgi:Myb-like DNA-binding protein REB1
MAKTQGLVYKKGKFSAIEEQQLADAIQVYKEVGSATLRPEYY